MRQCPSARLTSPPSSRTCGRQQVAEKDRAIGGDEFARLYALKDLPVGVALLPDLDGSFGETPAVGGDPDRLCTVALPNDAVESNCRRAHRRANADDKICEHARAQFVLWVLDLGANENAAGSRIDIGADGCDLAVEQ